VTPDELPGVLAAIAARAAAAAVPVADAMDHLELNYLTTNVLVRHTHPQFTHTNAPPGDPPALVTGTLRRSLRPVPAVGGGGYAVAWLAPHTVYARIQETGGDIYPVRRKYLRWFEDGAWHFAKHVHLPARPYMHPGRDDLVASGAFHAVAEAAFNAAVWG
jgi:hypothetical protein